MNKYNHLSQENRHHIEALLKEGLNQTQIANNIGGDKSTISRELSRNVTNEGPADRATRQTLLKSLPTSGTPKNPTTGGLPKP